MARYGSVPLEPVIQKSHTFWCEGLWSTGIWLKNRKLQ